MTAIITIVFTKSAPLYPAVHYETKTVLRVYLFKNPSTANIYPPVIIRKRKNTFLEGFFPLAKEGFTYYWGSDQTGY